MPKSESSTAVRPSGPGDDWQEDEQLRLEAGLVKAAAVCDLKEKWKVVSQEVGTRDARACAERYKLCRAKALQERKAAEEAEQRSTEEEQENDETEAPEDAASAEDASTAQGSRWNRSSRWQNGWQKSSGSWWNSDENWRGWQQSGEWQEEDWREGGHEPGAAAEETEGLSESERRALEARKEVEANRERMRRKAEREEEEKRRKEMKAAEEAEKRAQEKREYQEEQERKRQEQLEKQRQLQREQAMREQALQAKAAGANPAFAPQRIVGGKAQQVQVGWAAKAAAKQKGEAARRRKEEELEKQAAEAMAAIASTSKRQGGGASAPAASSGAAVQKEESDLEASEEEQEPEARPTVMTSRNRSPIGPPGPPPKKAANATPGSANHGTSSATKPDRPVGKAQGKQKARQKWWSKLDGDCPISLSPLGELEQPPFGLEADGSAAKHYFDARFLASWLLSNCDFIDPVNRRPLTHAECKALDNHMAKHYPQERLDSSVADAFALFEKHGVQGQGPGQVDTVQREATAVLQHLFRFSTGRRTDARGRAINYNDAGLTVVDDDDVLAAPAATRSAAASAAASRRAGPSSAEEDFPQLAPEGGASWAPGWSGAKGKSKGKGPGRPFAQEESFPAIGSTSAAVAAKAKAASWGPKAQAKASKGGTGRGRGKGGWYR